MAIGRDVNENMVSIALVLVQVDNKENWTWFLRELLEYIGGLEEGRCTFISCTQKCLVKVVKDLTPDSEHKFCLRHMYQNFFKKNTKG